MPLVERFTHPEILRLLGATEKQLAYWERLGLVRPHTSRGIKFYQFQDLISLRAVKQLTEGGVPARRLHRSVTAIQKQLRDVKVPLNELRIESNGRNVVVDYAGARVEPLSGQLLLRFDTEELTEKVRELPDRSAEEWLASALDLETDPKTYDQAIAAYRRVIGMRPDWAEPLLNLGTLLCERDDLAEAAECFRGAVALEPDDPLARFNLANVLDDLGNPEEAAEHLREAVGLSPRYADAHYNLAVVLEKLDRGSEARLHWAAYIKLDPNSQWADYARRQLGSPE